MRAFALPVALVATLPVPTSCGSSPPGRPPTPSPAAIAHPACLGTGLPRPGRPLRRSYATERLALERTRHRLSRELARATSPADRARVLRRARRALESGLARRLAPHWCGTPWAFHGTTQTPGRGHIACGYFVSTLLRDAGVKVARAPLARRPAEAIIKSVTGPRLIRRFSNAPIDRFVKQVARDGDGLAIVGLDQHVGFLRVVDGRVTFLHSSYLAPTRVVEEPALRSPALVASRYRVVGRFAADPTLLRRWLTGARVPTR